MISKVIINVNKGGDDYTIHFGNQGLKVIRIYTGFSSDPVILLPFTKSNKNTNAQSSNTALAITTVYATM